MGAFGGTVTLLGFRASANIGAKCAFKPGRRSAAKLLTRDEAPSRPSCLKPPLTNHSLLS